MANTAQARKRARQAEKRRQHNASLTSALRTSIKKVRKAIATGNKAAAEKQFGAAQAVIDRIADKKIIHKNAAARHKSRLVHRIRGMAG
jgi:small subunit ribosomal protein S20